MSHHPKAARQHCCAVTIPTPEGARCDSASIYIDARARYAVLKGRNNTQPKGRVLGIEDGQGARMQRLPADSVPKYRLHSLKTKERT